jgi:hypothetical protein
VHKSYNRERNIGREKEIQRYRKAEGDIEVWKDGKKTLVQIERKKNIFEGRD